MIKLKYNDSYFRSRVVLIASVSLGLWVSCVGSQAFYARESYLERSIRDLEADARGRQGKVDIDWDELDDLAPEWDRAESGIDDLLSLNTAYWEPGLGPRAPRNPVSHGAGPGRGRSGLLERGDTEDNLLLLDEDDISNPSSPQLDTLMHQAMAAVNTILDNLEREKGERDLQNASQLAKWSAVQVDVSAGPGPGRSQLASVRHMTAALNTRVYNAHCALHCIATCCMFWCALLWA